jgi:hypothetical protein
MVTVQVSVGELIDKTSILYVKLTNIMDEEKVKLLNNEFTLLYEASHPYLQNTEIFDLYVRLVDVNFKLWDVEDKLRVLETKKRFEGEFIDLARQVYHLNDERFSYKNQINHITDSEIKEVKQYVKYK